MKCVCKMNYTKLLIDCLKKQGIDLKIDEIPFNIFLKNTGDILTLSFIEYESDECLIVAETNEKGYEELRIIPKENIEYVGIFYGFKEIVEKKDKMYL